MLLVDSNEGLAVSYYVVGESQLDKCLLSTTGCVGHMIRAASQCDFTVVMLSFTCKR